MQHRAERPAIGVIGGTGLYTLPGLTEVEECRVSTPFGEPSDLVVQGVLDGTRVLFIPRHGRAHAILPSEVNYRANIMALKQLGAEWCIGVSAVGSLRDELRPGDVVIPDQVIDKTHRRASTFFGEGVVAHVSFAQPYCPVLRNVLVEESSTAGAARQVVVHPGGTYVCMEGPAFSSRAESLLHRSWGAHLIGMTNLPEAKLAREAEIAYATVALVTDYDCWRDAEGEHVDAHAVMAVLKKNADIAREIVARAVRRLGSLKPSAIAAEALRNSILSDLTMAPREAVERLRPILERYL